MVVFGPCCFHPATVLSAKGNSTGGARQESPCRSTGSMVCSGTFKLCPFLSCLSPHSPQLMLDCQTDKFSPVHSEFLSWPTLWAWRVPPRLPAPSLCSELSGLEAASFGHFPHCLQLCFLCFRAMCYSIIVSRLCSLMCPRPLCLSVSSSQVALATPTPCIHEKDSDRTEFCLCYSAACLEAHLPHRQCFHNDP